MRNTENARKYDWNILIVKIAKRFVCEFYQWYWHAFLINSRTLTFDYWNSVISDPLKWIFPRINHNGLSCFIFLFFIHECLRCFYDYISLYILLEYFCCFIGWLWYKVRTRSSGHSGGLMTMEFKEFCNLYVVL